VDHHLSTLEEGSFQGKSKDHLLKVIVAGDQPKDDKPKPRVGATSNKDDANEIVELLDELKEAIHDSKIYGPLRKRTVKMVQNQMDKADLEGSDTFEKLGIVGKILTAAALFIDIFFDISKIKAKQKEAKEAAKKEVKPNTKQDPKEVAIDANVRK